MKVKGLNGRSYNVKLTDYLINWEPTREVSAPQAAVKRFLYPYWRGHIVTEEVPVRWQPSRRAMRLDLCNWTRRIVVEVSPRSSHSFNQFFHKNRVNFGAAVKRDLDKEAWATANGFTFVEVGDEDIPQLSRAWFREHYQLDL